MSTNPEFGDLSQAAHEYGLSRRRLVNVVTEAGGDVSTLRVAACPAWTVKDVFSHVTGIAVDLAAGRFPEGDTQAWVDRQVEERRDLSLDEVIDEWSRVANDFESMIAQRPQRWWGLTYDTVVHEHDVRTALGVGGERSSSGVELAARLGLRLVAADLAARDLGAVEVVIDQESFRVGEGQPHVTLTGTSFEILRTLGSRRTLDEIRSLVSDGDLDVVIAGVLHMEPPESSLGEQNLGS